MNKLKSIIVVGYNGSRVMDIAKLRSIASARYDAQLILLVETLSQRDHLVADQVVQMSFAPSELDSAVEQMQEHLSDGTQIIGVLPFSDRGVLLGAALATLFSLPGITPAEARAGLDKQVLRSLEISHAEAPATYDSVLSYPVDNLENLIQRVQAMGGRAFIKPACEGASRGCQVIERLEQCASAWNALEPYHASGVIVETLVTNAREYSWDYVAGRSWITEKATTEGAYRAEIQQIVPAPLARSDAQRVEVAGEHIRCIVAPCNGAYHNEIFFKADRRTSAVETNMRPGGMHIWDLARHAFTDFDPWQTWVRWAVEGYRDHRPLIARGYCGIRLLSATEDGVLISLPDIARLAHALDIELIDSAYTKELGDSVSAVVVDNMGFIGHVIVFDTDAKRLQMQLLQLAESVQANISIGQQFLAREA